MQMEFLARCEPCSRAIIYSWGLRSLTNAAHNREDPTLRDFLSDNPSAIAGIRLQHMFERKYSRQAAATPTSLACECLIHSALSDRVDLAAARSHALS
jgi:hypothetical protein